MNVQIDEPFTRIPDPPKREPWVPTITPRRICNAVARFYGLRFHDLRARAHVDRLTEARRLTCYLLRELAALTFEQIGAYMQRHHTTIMASCREVQRRLTRWPDGPTADAVAQVRIYLAGNKTPEDW
jgi:chromosomal replication initiation ATPase DnaA